MTHPRKVLGWIVALVAIGMVATAIYCALHPGLSRETLGQIAGGEVVVMAVVVLPWLTVYSHKAAVRFSPGEAGAGSWKLLAYASHLLGAGQIVGYLPAVLTLGAIESVMVISGQLMPATFRICMCIALYRMCRAYRDTGLDFRMRGLDFLLSVTVGVVAIVLIVFRDTLFLYWSVNAPFGPFPRSAMIAAQTFNFLLYPAVFFLSLTMFRYATQMGGGLVARAWGGVALYGLLQPIHAFVIAIGYESYGPMLSIAFDNFIVLTAFSALSFGPIFQVEASDLKSGRRSG